MSPGVIQKDVFKRIKGIHKLSQSFNEKIGKDHQERILELMRKHIPEIEALVAKGDPHAFIETGDLIVLCFELLIENGISIDGALLQCFERYEKKLNGLLAQVDASL